MQYPINPHSDQAALVGRHGQGREIGCMAIWTLPPQHSDRTRAGLMSRRWPGSASVSVQQFVKRMWRKGVRKCSRIDSPFLGGSMIQGPGPFHFPTSRILLSNLLANSWKKSKALTFSCLRRSGGSGRGQRSLLCKNVESSGASSPLGRKLSSVEVQGRGERGASRGVAGKSFNGGETSTQVPTVASIWNASCSVGSEAAVRSTRSRLTVNRSRLLHFGQWPRDS